MTSIPPGLRVLHVEDDPADAELIEHALRRAEPRCVVHRVTDTHAFARALDEFKPDVILSDHSVSGFDPADALRVAQVRLPLVPFVLVGGAFGQSSSDLLHAGASDFVEKGDLGRLVPTIAAALILRAPLRRLTDRQREVLILLAAGGSTRTIARRLKVSVKTIETHRAQLMKRLGIRDLANLVRYAIRAGLIPAA